MVKKILLSVMVIGLVLTGLGLILGGGDFGIFVDAFNSDKDYEFIEKDGNEEISRLNIEVSSGKVVFNKYDGEGYKIDYYESKNDTKDVTVENNTLNIKTKSKWRFFTITFTTSKVSTINIYLPETFKGEANIETNSGSINITDFNFTILDIEVDSGSVNLKNVSIETDLKLDASSGNILIDKVNANNLDAKISSGKIIMDDSFIKNNCNLNTSSGKIEVTNSILPNVIARGNSGNINLLDVEIKDLDVRVDSGNIDLRLVRSVNDYKLDASVSSGKVYYQGKKINGSLYNPSGIYSVKARCSSGDIRIYFIENE